MPRVWVDKRIRLVLWEDHEGRQLCGGGFHKGKRTGQGGLAAFSLQHGEAEEEEATGEVGGRTLSL